MEEKYYTPELSEFYFGFEHEHYDFVTKIWNKVVIGSDFKAFQDLEKTLQTRRVKLLDKEDIESFGFEEFVHKTAKCYKLHNWLLYHSPNIISLNKFPLDTIRDSESGNQYFRGIVKNKSELKKLMSQLKIKHE